jgi:hypothetical protein
MTRWASILARTCLLGGGSLPGSPRRAPRRRRRCPGYPRTRRCCSRWSRARARSPLRRAPARATSSSRSEESSAARPGSPTAPSETPGESTRASHFAPGRRLGFRASPPNAALVVDRAKSSADTIAIELRLRSYAKRRRSARFAVRTLGSLGGELRHINRHIAHRLPHASPTPPSSSTTPALRRSAGPVPPKLTAPAAGAEYFITTNGAWPLSFGY